MKIESAKIEIDHLESINKTILKSESIDAAITSRKTLENELKMLKETCPDDLSGDYRDCLFYESTINQKRIYELTDRIREYNDELNSLQ